MFTKAARFDEVGTIQGSAEENDLVQAALEGDLNAFNRLVLDYQDRLYGWVYSLVKDEALADDVTQAAFITAYEKLCTFSGGSFRAWLFRIARNRSFDELRRIKRRPSVSLDRPASEDEEWDLLSVLPDKLPSPEQAVQEAEQANMIVRLLETLPEPFQQVLRLVDMEGLDYQEAANILGLPLGTVKSRVTRARMKLRDRLAHSGYGMQTAV